MMTFEEKKALIKGLTLTQSSRDSRDTRWHLIIGDDVRGTVTLDLTPHQLFNTPTKKIWKGAASALGIPLRIDRNEMGEILQELVPKAFAAWEAENEKSPVDGTDGALEEHNGETEGQRRRDK
jgi:hypothetical protein